LGGENITKRKVKKNAKWQFYMGLKQKNPYMHFHIAKRKGFANKSKAKEEPNGRYFSDNNILVIPFLTIHGDPKIMISYEYIG
jgi:hypothetical protein